MEGNRLQGAGSRRVAHGGFVLPPQAAEHLDAAMEQMDLFLTSKQDDDGISHVIVLLQHLLAVRQIVAQA